MVIILQGPYQKAAVSIFVSNAANLMRSIKDLLKALQLAQTIPNNFITTTTAQVTCTPLAFTMCPYICSTATYPKCHQDKFTHSRESFNYSASTTSTPPSCPGVFLTKCASSSSQNSNSCCPVSP